MNRCLAIVLLIVSSLALGCVTSSTHKEVVTERDELLRAKAAAIERAGKLEVSAASLEAERIKLYDELENLRVEKEELLGTRAYLEKDVASLREREDTLSKELETKSVALSEASKAAEDLQSSYQGLVLDLEREVQQGEIEIQQLRTGLQLAVSDEILFGSGSAKLDAGGVALLKKVANNIKKLDHAIDVEGHSDNVRITGPLKKRYPSNWELASARASSVVRLFEGQGIEGERLHAISRAEFAPIASNDNAEGRGKNRRIEIRLRPRKTTEVMADDPAPVTPPVAEAAEESAQESAEAAEASAEAADASDAKEALPPAAEPKQATTNPDPS